MVKLMVLEWIKTNSSSFRLRRPDCRENVYHALVVILLKEKIELEVYNFDISYPTENIKIF